MPRRWTIKELNETNDLNFAINALKDRAESITNVYTPLNQKINKAKRNLERLDRLITCGQDEEALKLLKMMILEKHRYDGFPLVDKKASKK